MISKQQQKYVQSLHNKKYRNEYGNFLVEGEKGILEIINSDFEIENIFCSESFEKKIGNSVPKNLIITCKESEIEQISTFKSNSTGVAVVKQKKAERKNKFSENEVVLILDDIKDPGNLGTIIRLADWYGIQDIFCSPETVEFYNPKVIAATMGSFTRTNVHYVNLNEFIPTLDIPILGAFLDGENIHGLNLKKPFGLIIGSESHGISIDVQHLVTQKITIPRIGKAESLNAGVATGIILDNIFRDF